MLGIFQQKRDSVIDLVRFEKCQDAAVDLPLFQEKIPRFRGERIRMVRIRRISRNSAGKISGNYVLPLQFIRLLFEPVYVKASCSSIKVLPRMKD